MMTRETLYDAMTEVKDGLVMEAMETKPAKSKVRWLKFGSIAAALAVVVGLGAGVLSGTIRLPFGGSAGGSDHEEGSTFMSYAGPVFPLTTAEGGEGLTAQRAITYDFEGWKNEYPYDLSVTDSYTLANPTGEDKTVTLLYPFAANLLELEQGKHWPTLTVDGEKADAALRAGGYAGGFGNGIFANQPGSSNLRRPRSWEDYKALLSDGSYQASALEDWPDLSHIPVTVYEITDPWVAHTDEREDSETYNPTIHASFTMDENKTTVLSYNFNSGAYDQDTGARRIGLSVPTPPDDPDVVPGYYEWALNHPHYLIVIGQPVENFALIGTSDGAPDSTSYLEWGVEIGANLRQYDTDLDSALRAVFDDSHFEAVWGSGVAADMVFGAMKDCLLSYGLLSDDPADRYSVGMLEELDYEGVDRVLYLETKVTIPAGGSVTVEARMLKEASFDFHGANTKNKGVYGYDLVTGLGSNLDFSTQTAKAVNTDGVEIVRQNFGFDWKNGVDTVTLDPAQEHYYLEVRGTNKK